jgi:hypothetical protein
MWPHRQLVLDRKHCLYWQTLKKKPLVTEYRVSNFLHNTQIPTIYFHQHKDQFNSPLRFLYTNWLFCRANQRLFQVLKAFDVLLKRYPSIRGTPSCPGGGTKSRLVTYICLFSICFSSLPYCCRISTTWKTPPGNHNDTEWL